MALFYQRALHILTSFLALVAQRLPFLKHLAPLCSSPATLRVATPLSVSFLGTHSLSGQSVSVVPQNGFEAPAEGVLGEEFLWEFTTSDHTAGSYRVDGLPPGIRFEFDSFTGDGILEGVPEVASDFFVNITGYRRRSFNGDQTELFVLPILISEPMVSGPYQLWRELHWSGSVVGEDEVSGPEADPDGDGMANVLEFFLNLIPTQAESQPGEIKVDPEDASMCLYRLPMNADASSVVVKFQRSISLKDDSWEDLENDPNYVFTTGEGEIVLRFPRVAGTEYIRLMVSL